MKKDLKNISAAGNPGKSSAAARAGRWFFRRRGFVLLPWVALILYAARPGRIGFNAGLAVALIGEALRVWAVGYSGRTTRGRDLAAAALATGGPYRFIRNPLYAGNWILWLGFTVMAGLWRPASETGASVAALRGVLGFVFLAFVAVEYQLIVLAEEEFLREKFGVEYENYRSRVARWLPLRPPFPAAAQRYELKAALRSERGTFISIVCLSACLLVLYWLRRPPGLPALLYFIP